MFVTAALIGQHNRQHIHYQLQLHGKQTNNQQEILRCEDVMILSGVGCRLSSSYNMSGVFVKSCLCPAYPINKEKEMPD